MRLKILDNCGKKNYWSFSTKAEILENRTQNWNMDLCNLHLLIISEPLVPYFPKWLPQNSKKSKKKGRGGVHFQLICGDQILNIYYHSSTSWAFPVIFLYLSQNLFF